MTIRGDHSIVHRLEACRGLTSVIIWGSPNIPWGRWEEQGLSEAMRERMRAFGHVTPCMGPPLPAPLAGARSTPHVLSVSLTMGDGPPVTPAGLLPEGVATEGVDPGVPDCCLWNGMDGHGSCVHTMFQKKIHYPPTPAVSFSP